MREAFALQKLLKFFLQKCWHICGSNIGNFNETLTNDVVSFEQPGPNHCLSIYFVTCFGIVKCLVGTNHLLNCRYKIVHIR